MSFSFRHSFFELISKVRPGSQTHLKIRLRWVLITTAVLAVGPLALAAQPAKPANGAASKPMDQRKPDPKTKAIWEDMAKTGFPPTLKGVVFSPAAPKAGQPTKVVATFMHNLKNATKEAKTTKFQVVKAFLRLSTDGGKKWSFPMMMKKVKPNVFEGKIPPQAKGVKVLVALSGEDQFGNGYVELACKITTPNPATDPCLFESAKDKTPVDDPTIKIPDSHDILKTRLGYDDQKLYVIQTVQGKVTGGTLNPMKANSYISMFMETENPEKLESLFSTGKLALYAPLAKTLTGQARSGGNSDIPSIAPCGLLNGTGRAPDPKKKGQKPGDFFDQDTVHISCKPTGPELVFAINWAGLNPKFRKSFRSSMGNATIKSMMPPSVDVQDWTRPAQVFITNRVLLVK